MSLIMSKQAIIESLNSNAAKYRKTRSRKAKSELLMQLMELTGYKSSKSIIRYYSRVRKRRRIALPQKTEPLLILKIDLRCGIRYNPPHGK